MGFTVGGTVHVIVNNLIGFTATPNQLHSSRFAADVAKRQAVPFFHVNGEARGRGARWELAAEYRSTFASDVVVDLIGYRRHGHSEVDDATVSQPKLYRAIKEHPPLWRVFPEETGIDVSDKRREILTEFQAAQADAAKVSERPALSHLPSYWHPYSGGCYNPELEVDTGISAKRSESFPDTHEISARFSHPSESEDDPQHRAEMEQESGRLILAWRKRWPLEVC